MNPAHPGGWPRALAFLPRAERDAAQLPADVWARVLAAVARYAASGVGDVKPLTGARPPEHRLRVGDYRAFLAEPPPDAPDTLPVVSVRNRREAY